MPGTYDDQLKRIFGSVRTVAVVGLSDDLNRPSNQVSRFLKSKGYRIIPVNPNIDGFMGEPAYPDLASVPDRVDLVQIFRQPEYVPAIIEQAIAKGAQAVWMQDGSGHEEAANKARQAGLQAVVDDCMLRQYQRLIEGG